MNSKGAKNLLIAAVAASTIGIGSHALAQDPLEPNIADVEGLSSGTAVSLSDTPVITAILSSPGTIGSKTYANWSFLVQDSSGSVDVFYSSTASSYVPVVGNTVNLGGTWSPFDGIPEIANASAGPISISTAGTASVPAVQNVTIPQINVTSETANGVINTPYAGTFVQLNNVTISGTGVPGSFPAAGSNGSYTITDPGNNNMILFFWTSSYSTDGALGGSTIPTGPVDMDGFVDFFAASSEAEFVATSITPVPEPAAASLYGIGSVLAGFLCYRFRRKI